MTLTCPGTPNPSGTPESFMDTMLVNGTAYPKVTVDPAAYRMQILSAGNDRAVNLQLYVAEPLSLAVTNPGSGYTSAPTVAFSGGAGGGTGAAATATVSGGAITDILVTGVGAGYTSAPLVTITGDGTGAAAFATIDPIVGQVNAIVVTSGGTGYTTATVTLSGGGAITNATATALIAPAGTVLSITVTNPGSAPWTAAPTVTLTGGAGTGATAIASVNTEFKMVDAVAHTAQSPLPLCAAGAAINPVTGLPRNCWPSVWPTDMREGGVPDPLTAGPPFVQIGTEGGLLSAPVVIPSTPVGFEFNRRSITVLNIFTHGLLLGPAERADAVVDFTAFAGKTLILYNDAPAPVPAFDPRIDYFTGDADQTLSGGAPSTLPGYGPNTRTIMQINVAASRATPQATAFSLATLQAQMPNIFVAATSGPGEKIIVPQMAYPAGNGGSTRNTYVNIFDTSLSFFGGGPVGGLTLVKGGIGYTSTPSVTLTGGGGAGATATAAISAPVGSVTVNSGGSYTIPPNVVFTGGGGTGAAATARLRPVSLTSITVPGGGRGSGYTSAPTVTIAPPGCIFSLTCQQATATANISGGQVISVTLVNRGAGYTSVPAVTISGGGGTGARATAVLPASPIASIVVTAGGSGYTSAPAVSFSGGAATATAVLGPGRVTGVTLTAGGTGYTTPPTVTVAAPVGCVRSNTCLPANVVATGTTIPLIPKAIHELFTLDYGRMNAVLGVELPFTNFLTQTTIPYAYVDPPTEMFKDGEVQIWKITHNGVDTHFMHFHLFNVQVLNRVGWDGAVKPPDANELSWKDTVRMNPLEDIIVALRPLKQTLPWDLPNSVRLLDVTKPAGVSLPNQFTNVDPTNQPAVVTNDLTNFGWEYVWHCHILGHEENDMMRAMVLAVPPRVPTAAPVPAAVVGSNIVLNWRDASLNETGFTIQRATNAAFTTGLTSYVVGPGVQTFTNTGTAQGTTYWYRVIANNRVGYTKTYAVPGYPNFSADSAPLLLTPSGIVRP